MRSDHGATFAAALLDVSLPDGGGRHFCTSLRRQGFHLPVILPNGLGDENNLVRGVGAVANDYRTKPFSIAELLARIAAKLRHAAPRARLLPAQFGAAA